MCLPVRLCALVLPILFVFDGVLARSDGSYRRGRTRQSLSYQRDWDTDWKQWARDQSRDRGDPVPDHDHTKGLSTRQLSPAPQDTRTMWVSRQRGSAVVPYPGATVRVAPRQEPPQMLYRGEIKATVSDRPRRRGHRSHRLRHGGSNQDQWQYSQDQPLTPRPRPQPCARCPGDRAVLAPKGSNTVLMDNPPIIPCHPWSSVKKVKSEVMAGPQPGSEMAEGSHKMVLRLYRRKRNLATCVIRYNVIVRKCPDLELGSGLKAECTLDKAWGSRCNLSCDPGYVLEGDSTTECSDVLEWTGDQPQCILSTACPVPVSPENGHLSCRTPQHKPISLQEVSMLPDGTVCHFRCQPGFLVPPEQSHLTRVRCIAGSWDSDQDPDCVEMNELAEVEEELPPDISVEDALRLDGKGCPEDYCLNGGKCLTILDTPMCSCQPGYSGHQCEEEDLGPGTEDNTIT